MEAIRKQASKLREQVAKQQQAVLKQFSGRFGLDSVLHDEAELQCHQKLQMLYGSTRAAKHLQRDIARGVEAFISVISKQIEISRKLAQDCCIYGDEYETSGYALARASSNFGNSHNLIDKEREDLLRVFGEQVYEPLRAMVMGAPLEDARHLTYRYGRIRQDVEAQTADIVKRQLRAKEVAVSVDSAAKLQTVESKLLELKRALSALGREATEAMLSVEAQQQEVTFQILLAMVDAERSFHKNVAATLDKLYDEMIQVRQHAESASKPTSEDKVSPRDANIHATVPNVEMDIRTSQFSDPPANRQNANNDMMTSQSREAPENKNIENANTKVCQPRDVPAISQPRDVPANRQNANNDKKTSQSREAPENKNIENANTKVYQPRDVPANSQPGVYYVAEVIHPFDAQTDGELSLSVGDYVVVRQAAPIGWSEGECKGKAGWFPSAYIEKREKAPASKVMALLSC